MNLRWRWDSGIRNTDEAFQPFPWTFHRADIAALSVRYFGCQSPRSRWECLWRWRESCAPCDCPSVESLGKEIWVKILTWKFVNLHALTASSCDFALLSRSLGFSRISSVIFLIILPDEKKKNWKFERKFIKFLTSLCLRICRNTQRVTWSPAASHSRTLPLESPAAWCSVGSSRLTVRDCWGARESGG